MVDVEAKPRLPDPVRPEQEAGGTDAIRRIAAERRRKSDTDGRRRRDLQTAEDHRLL